jgi:glyoxylase-like metal-dependent hydrolase (beta-lactamase superfamily II)
VPKKLWQRYFEPDEENLIPMNQNCLFVRAGGKNIIVDTGLGTKLNDKVRRMWKMQHENGLLRGLAALGVQPEQIDLVIDTHLHADHAGGNTRWDDEKAGTVRPAFPNAEYVVQRREYEDAMQPNERTAATYMAFNYQPLVASGQMRLLDGETEFVTGIRGIPTPGHTPGHMSIFFESGGEHAIFLCDLASYAVHFERIGWMTAYDVEPLITLETKRIWQKWALEHDALLIFPHDSKRPAGKLFEMENGTILIRAVDVPYVLTE